MRVDKLLKSKLRKFDKIFGIFWFTTYSTVILYIFYETLVYTEKINNTDYVVKSALELSLFLLVCFIVIFIFARHKYKRLIFLR